MKVLLIFGTRPEAIKMAPLYKELITYPQIDVKVCVSAQHREMLDQVLNHFNIIPDFDLNIMKKNQSIAEIVSLCILKINEILQKENFDYILVHGDTSTTLAASLAAYFNKISVAHIEAGLRTNNKYSPFPEEINRQVSGIIADYHFTPTEETKNNLLKENKDKNSIFVVGNTAIDVFKYTIKNEYNHPVLKKIQSTDKIILLTTHRRENWGIPMENIFEAVNILTNKFSDLKFIYPVHLNPNIQQLAKKYFHTNNQVLLIDPIDVFDFHNLINKSYLVLTDSGGIQEEAAGLNKPVLVLRDTTERPEGVKSGILKLVGTNTNTIVQTFEEIYSNNDQYIKMKNSINPYGNGTASKQIVTILLQKFQENN